MWGVLWFQFKCRFWKEILVSGKWSMHEVRGPSVKRAECISGPVELKDTDSQRCSWLTQQFACSLCLCLSAEPAEVTRAKVEPCRGTQVTSRLLFKLKDQVSFAGMFHWQRFQSRLVFNPFCLTWKGTIVDCFDPFNSPPCVPTLQGGQHLERSVLLSFKSAPEDWKKRLLFQNYHWYHFPGGFAPSELAFKSEKSWKITAKGPIWNGFFHHESRCCCRAEYVVKAPSN